MTSSIRTTASNPTAKAFAARLISACDSCAHIPPPYQGRQTYIAGKISVSQEAVRKWLAGIAMPKRPKMEALATLLGVDYAWLSLGIKPEASMDSKRLAGKVVEAGAMLVAGKISLYGGTCSFPEPGEAEGVHLFAILKGRMLSIHVCSFRKTIPGIFEISIPSNFEKLTMVGFTSEGDCYKMFDIPAELINQYKVLRADDYTVTIELVDGSYFVGDHELQPFDPLKEPQNDSSK